MSHRRSIVLLSVLLVCSISFSGLHVSVAQIDSDLLDANTAVEQAFVAVADAKSAGANITLLMDKLNLAAAFLSQAEMGYRIGDLNLATNMADNAMVAAQEVLIDAQSLKEEAAVSSQNTFWTTIIVAIISCAVFVAGLFLLWREFKQDYLKRAGKIKT
ncbi:MAG: hypothetical protein NWF04_03940 [Candidatus Bathyarchaeota archaeon]|nr:hypothetical protein [Candidatus Bathyarchaeota archaeon]